jgi:sterol-4alpha-carboxylate 3-dehydrogenase (decarboxylating)
MTLDGATVLVSGGCGQVGIAIVQHLQAHYPSTHIVVLDLAKPEASHARNINNVTYFPGDITKMDTVQEVFNRVRPLVVFHTAGLIPQIAKRLHMNDQKHYMAVNVQGTKNLLEAAQRVGSVRAFVHTSSADVIKGDSWGDLKGVDESMPIPATFDDFYAESKVCKAFLFCPLCSFQPSS